MKEAVPTVARVGLLWSESSPWQPLMVREAEKAAGRLRLQLQAVGFHGAGDFEAAFTTLGRQRAEAVIVLPDQTTFVHRKFVDSRWPSQVNPQPLMVYGASREHLARQTAVYVDRILKGAQAGDLPIQQPAKFELLVNRKTAKALGLTLPQSLLVRADHVTE